MSGAEFCGTLGDRGGERDDGDSHAGDRLARVPQPFDARERYEALAVGAGRREQLPTGAVCLLHIVNGALVMLVLAVEQSDQDASRRGSAVPLVAQSVKLAGLVEIPRAIPACRRTREPRTATRTSPSPIGGR